MVDIHPTGHNKLIAALRTAIENGEVPLDKDPTSFMTLLTHSIYP